MAHHHRAKPRDPHRRGGWESEGRAAIAKDRARQDELEEGLALAAWWLDQPRDCAPERTARP